MPDNVGYSPGSGLSVASDDIAGVHYQRIKLVLGADGVNDGDVSGANPIPVTSNMGATAVTTRVEAQDVLYASFLIKAANANRKELIVLSHGSGSLHLCFFNPATYVSPIELFFHDVWVEDRYTGDVYGKFHTPPYGTLTAVTFQAAANTVTMAGHGRTNNELVSFTSITTTTGINTSTNYYVIDETENTFKLSLTSGGTEIDLLTGDGTGLLHPLTGFCIITEISL